MTAHKNHTNIWKQRVVTLSLILLFFTIPHVLEDFALGEPAEAGVPAPVLATAISIVFFIQAMGLYWLGQEQRRGIITHLIIGLFWPIASGFAQLPAIFSGAPYRSGFISVLYVGGMIIVGIFLVAFSLLALAKQKDSSEHSKG